MYYFHHISVQKKSLLYLIYFVGEFALPDLVIFENSWMKLMFMCLYASGTIWANDKWPLRSIHESFTADEYVLRFWIVLP